MGLRISQSAKIYADALLNLNIDDKKLIDDISNILDAITNSNDLDSVLNNPVIENNSKFEIINEIFRSKIDDKILEFIKILIEKKRISQLPEIKASLIEKLNSKNNIKLVQITSAIELNDYYKTKVISVLEKKLKQKVKPEWILNPDIIAGLKIKIDDTIIDTSINAKLENLDKIMK